MNSKPYFILTGAPGGGKTTLIDSLSKDQIITVDEPARGILAEQRSIGAAGTPEQDPELFCTLLLSRSRHLLASNLAVDSELPLLFDRGVADCVAYAQLLNVDDTICWNAAKLAPVPSLVFYLPPWPEIYVTDDERTMTFEASAAFGENMLQIYQKLGATIVEVGKVPVEDRATQILEAIKNV